MSFCWAKTGQAKLTTNPTMAINWILIVCSRWGLGPLVATTTARSVAFILGVRIEILINEKLQLLPDRRVEIGLQQIRSCRVAPRIPPRAPPQIRTRPFRASGSSGLRFCCPLLSATVALTRLLMTLSSSRVSQWQFRKPTPPLATHRLPRVGFPAF
jgi:hypothetical protein